MTALRDLEEAEAYLFAILTDRSGLDLAEFDWFDAESGTGVYRAWDFQWKWYSCDHPYQVDQGGRATGKALSLDTLLATESGWTTMGEVRVGDRLFDERGRLTTVTHVHGIRHGRECFEVTFSDGSTIVADAEHLWLTRDKKCRVYDSRRKDVDARHDEAMRLAEANVPWQRIADRLGYKSACAAANGARAARLRSRPVVRDTREIRDSLHVRGEANHSIDVALPLQTCQQSSLPVPAYTLGAWLGDGNSNGGAITTPDIEVLTRIRQDGFRVTHVPSSDMLYRIEFDDIEYATRSRGLTRALRDLGVYKNKHIPLPYLRASESHRRELLAGLFDTDGYMARRSHEGQRDACICEITFCTEQLSNDVFDLLISLGEHPHMAESDAKLNGRTVGRRWRVTWRPIRNPALLPRKRDRYLPLGRQSSRVTQRRIIAVKPVPSVPVRCITVDSPSHLYLAGRTMIPTHNTVSIQMRCCAFPFNFPGQDMLITAPELNHLRPLTNAIEERLRGSWLLSQMRPGGKSDGFVRAPHWECRFTNGTRLISRLPNKDGRGLKGSCAAGTVILTRRGLVPVEEVVEGDEVLTHEGRWRRVFNVSVSHDVDLVTVGGMGHRGLTVSWNHRFWGRRNRNPQRTRNLANPTWVAADDEEMDRWYLASPMRFPPAQVPSDVLELSRERGGDLASLFWVFGRYVADGYMNGASGFGLTVNRDKAGAVAGRMSQASIAHSVTQHDDRHADRILGNDRGVRDCLLRHFGRLAGGKTLPVWMLGVGPDLRQAFLDGYLHGDGYWCEERHRWQAGAASKQLAIGLKLLAQSLGLQASYSWVDPKVDEICGVKLKATPQRSHIVHMKDPAEGGIGLVDGRHLWRKARKAVDAGKGTVYTLAVEGDHSYISDGIVSHNQHVISIEMDECFPAGTLVLTRGGHRPIETIAVGDEVLTHKNRWRRVTATMTRPDREVVSIRGMGHPALACSPNHKFYSLRNVRRLAFDGDAGITTYGSGRTIRVSAFDGPAWTPASDLAPTSEKGGPFEGAWWSSPTTFPKVKGNGIPSLTPGHRRGALVDVTDPDFYWIAGLWVAEGSVGSSKGIDTGQLDRITFSIHEDEAVEVLRRLEKVGLRPSGPYPIKSGRGVNIVLYGKEVGPFAAWLVRHFGARAHDREIAPWALGLPRSCREQLLAGYLFGDGCEDSDPRYRALWRATTVSKALAVSVRLLALSLGYEARLHWNDLSGSQRSIRGRPVHCDGHWQIAISGSDNSQGKEWESKRWTPVRAVTQTGRVETLYDLTVDEDHSFIAEGIVVSNCQDFPLAGWIEIVECLNRFLPDARWHCHGVPRGVRDRFYEITQGRDAQQWTVHRPMAMQRPSWSDAEREEKTSIYGGSRQAPDYKRNIYGEHGDSTNPIFVIARLVKCCDLEPGSDYNSDVYTHVQLIAEEMKETPIMMKLPPSAPATHTRGWSAAPKGYSSFYAGMDVGVTNHPSEILLFGQRAGVHVEQLDLLLRIHMQRISVEDQEAVVAWLFDAYGSRLRTFGIDRTGLGFPLWERLGKTHGEDRVKGYAFSAKYPVALEDRELDRGETPADLVIERNIVEFSTDALREIVDANAMLLPNDSELLQEFQGQSYCCELDTEIFTQRGWLRHDEVRVGDRTLGLVPSGGETFSKWTPVTAVNHFPSQSRNMVRLEGQCHRSLTTADHRWLVKRFGTAKYHTWVESRDLLGDYRYRLPLMADRVDLPGTPVYDDDFVELVAWYYTEGHRVDAAYGGRVCVGQSPTASPQHVARLRDLLDRMLGPGNVNPGRGRKNLPGSWTLTEGGACTFSILDRDLCARVFAVTDGEKVVAPEFLVRLTSAQLDLFIDASLWGDGCEFTRSRQGRGDTEVRMFTQCHEGRTRAFEMACALRGIPTHTVEKPGGKFVVTLLKRRFASSTSLSRSEEAVDCEVWCPTTGSGTWLARYKGAVFFTGNSIVKSNSSAYGRKSYSQGKFHALDAARMMIAGKRLAALDEVLHAKDVRGPVLDAFIF